MKRWTMADRDAMTPAEREQARIDRALRALERGHPFPVIDLAAEGVIPTDAPCVADAWRLANVDLATARAIAAGIERRKR